MKYVEGEIGLIISEHMHVSVDGQGTINELKIYDNNDLDLLKYFTDEIHSADGIIFAQLEHAGVHATEYLTGQ